MQILSEYRRNPLTIIQLPILKHSVSPQLYYILSTIELLVNLHFIWGLSPAISTESTVVSSSHDCHQPDAPAPSPDTRAPDVRLSHSPPTMTFHKFEIEDSSRGTNIGNYFLATGLSRISFGTQVVDRESQLFRLPVEPKPTANPMADTLLVTGVSEG